jgi:rhodanese-related sulfurtransferase
MSESERPPITRGQLAKKLDTASPDDEDTRRGYALIDVLQPEAFERERIPGSVDIPAKEIEVFENRFDEGEEIIVYFASAN